MSTLTSPFVWTLSDLLILKGFWWKRHIS